VRALRDHYGYVHSCGLLAGRAYCRGSDPADLQVLGRSGVTGIAGVDRSIFERHSPRRKGEVRVTPGRLGSTAPSLAEVSLTAVMRS
jgi:hypothetical protein